MIELLEAAEEELLAAIDWYEEQREGLGLRFLTEAGAVWDSSPNPRPR